MKTAGNTLKEIVPVGGATTLTSSLSMVILVIESGW
jgi:hypothetical protein